ncbi:MAG: glutathione S-transferase family protein [Ferrovibrio sp.]
MMKIHGHPKSINVRKVLWLCAELGLPYEREDWGGYGEFRSLDDPVFRAMNPAGLIPVIEDDGVVLSESNTILRYLAAKAGRHDLLPTDPAGRAGIERWMDWQATNLNPSWQVCYQSLVKGSAEFGPEAVAVSVRRFNAGIGLIEAQLAKTGSYIAGTDFTLADIPVGLSVHRWYSVPMGDARPDYSLVAAYYDRLNERPGYQAHGRNGFP